MSNKQEFPNLSKPEKLSSYPSSKTANIYTNHPYFDNKPILKNDYTCDLTFPLKPGPIQANNNPKYLSPLILENPSYPNIYNNNENLDQNFTQIKDFQADDKFSQANIHDSFKFSEFQSDYH